MTEPMLVGKRFIIFLAFILLFTLLIPVVILYSTGYRVSEGFSLTPTGGIYVYYPESGANLYINGELTKQTSLFARGLFVDDLSPKEYKVQITKKGYQAWNKTLNVGPKRVSEAYPFLIPQIIATTTVQRNILSQGATTTNPLYTDLSKLFSTSTVLKSTSRLVASTTAIVPLLRKDTEIYIATSSVIALWKGSSDSIPYYFCDEAGLKCSDTLTVLPIKVNHIEFYQGRDDVIIYSTKDGIFVTELDQREPRNTFKLIDGNLEFRELNQRVYVKAKTGFYEIELVASTTLERI